VIGIAARLRPGACAAELVEAGKVIEEAGFTTVEDLLHGFGRLYLPSVIGSASRSLHPIPDLEIEAGMTVVIQPSVVTQDAGIGVQTGEVLYVTATGAERLHTFDRGLGRLA